MLVEKMEVIKELKMVVMTVELLAELRGETTAEKTAD